MRSSAAHGLTRALIADADWPVKACAGRLDEISRIALLDNFCWGEIQAGKPLAEVNNPQLGRKGESGWYTPAALKRRPVAVVGAGPAGLQAAAVAAQAGNLKSAPEGPQSTTLELSLINLAPWSSAPADDLPTRHASATRGRDASDYGLARTQRS
jgi:2,4-dienoyl-CoA reductase (NADPH2)